MKIISASLLWALMLAHGMCVQSLFAQDDIVLYGLRINLVDDVFAGINLPSVESVDLQTINPATGEENFLFTIAGAQSVAAGSSSYDADDDQYFFWGNDLSNTQRIYSLDLAASEIASSPETTELIFDIEYNYADGKVYGLQSTVIDNAGDPFDPNNFDPANPFGITTDLDLVELDLETGAAVVVSALPETQAAGQGNSTFDPINNQFIFLSFNGAVASVVGIDVTTGETAFSTALDSLDGQVLAFEYDWTNERLLAIRQTFDFDLINFTSLIKNFLVEIDLETGAVHDISATPAFEDTGVAIGGVAFDQRSGTYITYVQGTTLGMISVETGQVFNMVQLPALLHEIQVDNLAYARSLNIQSAPPLPGDLNQDGAVNFLDISPFVSLLAAGDYLTAADINEDGAVNFLDIGPFIGLLSGG